MKANPLRIRESVCVDIEAVIKRGTPWCGMTENYKICVRFGKLHKGELKQF